MRELSVKQPANSSELVSVLLEDDFDPKEFALNTLPSALETVWAEVQRRVRERLENAPENIQPDVAGEYVADIAIEIANEVAKERGLDGDNHFMWRLQSMASRSSSWLK